MLKIWGRTNSVNVQKAMWCIGELRLAHERIDAGMAFGKNREDWYLAMNPNGLIPVIDDDGFQLWESNAIVRYLAEKHDLGGLCPGDLATRARAGQWMDWQVTALGPPITKVFWELVRTAPEARDPAGTEEAAARCRELFALLDRALAGGDYLLGERFTMADIPAGAMTHRWYALEVEHPELPNLAQWYARLCGRSAFRDHVMLPLS
jgi:glutathione S-transferase